MSSCCAVGCHNRQRHNKDLKFYRIPKNNTPYNRNRRRLWLQAIRRDPWGEDLIKNARLCSAHFISGAVSMDYYSLDFVPSIFPHTNNDPNESKAKLERFERKRRRDGEPIYHRPLMVCDNPNPQRPIEEDSSVEPCTEATVPKEEWPIFIDDDLQLKFTQPSAECVNLRSDINKLKAENEQLKEKLRNTEFSYSSIKSKAASVLFFTGLTSVIFEWLVLKCKAYVAVVRASKSLEDHLLVILMKLRLGLSDKDLAFRFNVTECDISKIFRGWLPVMSKVLKIHITWPSKHVVLKTMPKCFKPKYKHARCIIDCTEIFIHRPSNLTSRAQSWSNYKHHNTIKYLVGMSPAGSISFLSPGMGGQTSDRQMTVKSGFLKLLEQNDEILADRGFAIRDELAVHGATLKIHHFTTGKKQLSAQEVDTSGQLSNVRTHIERVIGRWKTFKILSTVIPVTQADLLDDMVIVCGALTNLCKSVVPRR